MVWKFKECPRCGGDVYTTSDSSGHYEQCLQCGCSHEVSGMAGAKRPGLGRRKDPVTTKMFR